MAFDLFAREGVDAAVIETGLGGRLDSTNVLSPVVASVTSIGIDHVEYLGETREEIAGEKAGIFKANVPAVIGERDRPIASLLAKLARDRGAHPIIDVVDTASPSEIVVNADGTTFEMTIGNERGLIRTALAGDHQASNAALALTTLNAAGGDFSTTLEEARSALPSVRLPGRFQRVGNLIFDVAHNPDGTGVLATTILGVAPPRPIAAVLCVLGDKDWRGMMTVLSTAVNVFVLTDAPTAPASRAWDRQAAADFARSNGWEVISEPDFDRAIDHAKSIAKTVVITGSFHTVGDAMARLNVDPVDG
jgi:dihydrofolate synthase/folylpolyglutamate synthase